MYLALFKLDWLLLNYSTVHYHKTHSESLLKQSLLKSKMTSCQRKSAFKKEEVWFRQSLRGNSAWHKMIKAQSQNTLLLNISALLSFCGKDVILVAPANLFPEGSAYSTYTTARPQWKSPNVQSSATARPKPTVSTPHSKHDFTEVTKQTGSSRHSHTHLYLRCAKKRTHW